MKTLIIFAKAPKPGFVKTRLVRETVLDETQVCALYEAFFKDTITVATLTEADKIAVHFTPEDQIDSVRKLVSRMRLGLRNEKRFTFTPQKGDTFTERVANAFENEGTSNPGELIMIGTDSPLIKPEIIDSAFEFIYSRSGLALGPSGEGGVYLIGYPSTLAIGFDNVFTEGSEIENLLDQAKKLGAPVRLCPEVLDVDVQSDLVTLIGIIRTLAYEMKFDISLFPTHTSKAIEKLDLHVIRSKGGTRAKKIAVK